MHNEGSHSDVSDISSDQHNSTSSDTLSDIIQTSDEEGSGFDYELDINDLTAKDRLGGNFAKEVAELIELSMFFCLPDNYSMILI